MNYKENIGGLRGLCAVLVVFLHIYTGANEFGWFMQYNVEPWKNTLFLIASFRNAVELFFVISGYLITITLLKHGRILQFAVNRFWRIYPTHIFITTLLFIGGMANSAEIFKNLNFMQALTLYAMNIVTLPGIFEIPSILGVAWSLSYELLFYFVSASYLFLFRISKKLSFCLMMSMVILIAYCFPITIFFAAGVLVYLSGIDKRSIRLPGGALVGGVFCILMIAAFLCLCELALRTSGGFAWVFLFLSFMMSILLFTVLVTDHSKSTAVFRLRPMQYLGKISFSLYMWHTVVEFFIKRLIQYWDIENGILKFCLLIIMLIPTSIIIADLNFRLIETWLPKIARNRKGVSVSVLNQNTART